MTRDPLDAFDADLWETVAADHDVDAEALSALARAHQAGIRELPGVENLVYEWRRSLPVSPLVERREDVYLLRVEDAVWGEFRAVLDCDDAEFAALRAAHARQFERSLDDDLDAAPEGAFVLTRP